MRDFRVNYLALGLLSMGAVVLLALAMLAASTWAPGTVPYHAYFSEAAGVTVGAEVHYAGYVIGRVTAVEPERGLPGLRFRIVFQVSDKWQLPEDSAAVLFSPSPLQTTVVKISPGVSEVMKKPGERIDSRDQPEGPVEQIVLLTRKLQTLLEATIQPTIEQSLTQLKQLEGWMGERAKDSEEIAADLKRIVADIQKVVESLTKSGSGGQLNELTAVVANANKVLQDVSRATGEATKLATETREQLMPKLGNIATEQHVLAYQLSTVVEQNTADIRAIVQTLSLSITPLMYNLEEATRTLLELARELRENPGMLVTGKEKAADEPKPPRRQ